MDGTEWQPLVAAIVKVERTVLSFQPTTGLWKRLHEDVLYLFSRPIAVARKLADILHSMWIDGTDVKVGFGAKVTRKLKLRPVQ